MKLTIDDLELPESTLDEINRRIVQGVTAAFEAHEKRKELPRYMNKAQAAQYMNVSYNTMMKKYVPKGLKIIIIDSVERLDQKDCDDFMEKNKK